MNIGRLTRMLLLTFLGIALAHPIHAGGEPVKVTIGSKNFTESVILGDMLTHLVQRAGFEASHQRQLGGTRVV
ncbi:L-proline glycine betaine binding ABC transporter protein ProX (TC 3.A.1.12.1) / Osmotic adaptation, partial [hydrothermal vent metagenome]